MRRKLRLRSPSYPRSRGRREVDCIAVQLRTTRDASFTKGSAAWTLVSFSLPVATARVLQSSRLSVNSWREVQHTRLKGDCYEDRVNSWSSWHGTRCKRATKLELRNGLPEVCPLREFYNRFCSELTQVFWFTERHQALIAHAGSIEPMHASVRVEPPIPQSG